ncbi:unnamed protein product [Rhizoctonia solani]|nr:unnamed protein product [Rhizoctonia solani]
MYIVRLIIAYCLRGSIYVGSLISQLRGYGPLANTCDFPPDEYILVLSTKDKRGIRVNVYNPPTFKGKGSKGKYPVHINAHGSGFVITTLFRSDSEFCRKISRETGAIVLDSDYAKAPEHPFPAAYNDICDVVAHVLANRDGNYDTSRITIGGFSAGASLALVVSATMPKDTFKAITAFYPVTNLCLTNSERPHHVEAKSRKLPRLPPFLLNYFLKTYIAQTTALGDPRLSPYNNTPSAFAERVLLVVCEFDPLRDEAIVLGKMLQKEGKLVRVVDIPGVLHSWDKDINVGVENDLKRAMAYDAAAEVLRSVY